MKLLSAQRIWDLAPHNAFTDLIRYKDQWFCVFREGNTHISPDGKLRVLTSADGEHWNSAALVSSRNSDLRDPKLAVSPDGRLMLSAAEALHDRSEYAYQSLVWFSNDGYSWSEKQGIGDPDFWLWRLTWHKGCAYSVGYSTGDDRFVRLYRSDDGKQFIPLVSRLFSDGEPNESSIVFRGDIACCLLRRDGKPNTGLVGISEPPYTDWEWKDLGVRIGGPHMLLLPDGGLVAVVRLYDGTIRTPLCSLDPGKARLAEMLVLPSGGDTSYAGLALHNGQLWVSYYSSHEGKTAIYLAEIDIGL
ncbi:MAG: exo-alpha-sialidase [Betaproteobacteria bacterium]